MIEILKKFDFFNALDETQLKYVSSISAQQSYQAGSMLFFEKEQPKSLILLTKGLLKVYKTDLKNNEIVLHRFSPFSLVAEMAVMEHIPFPASAMFERDGEVILIDYQKLQKLCVNNPDFSMGMVRSLNRKIKNLERVIELNIVLDSTSRLAKYIVEHEHKLGDLKHYQMADELHMTPETLSRVFKRLSTLQLIEKKSHTIKIINKEGLRVLFEA